MISINAVGNISKDPELKYTNEGKAWCTFDVAFSQGKDKPAMFFTCVCFDKYAENVAESFTKGNRVGVTGTLNMDEWTGKDDGVKHKKYKIVAQRVSADLAWDTATINHVAKQQEAETMDEEIPF
jgi:single-strand DNA-binding protein